MLLVLQTATLAVIAPRRAEAGSVKVGLVPDVGGIDDLSFNYSAYQGLQRAEDELGVVGTVYTTTSDTQSHYESRLQDCVDEGNDLCIAVGFGMGAATLSKANANPGTFFAIIDFTYESYPSNLRGMNFASDEAGYLASTLAGMMTASDVIGAVGGMAIPPVELFVGAYENAAQCFNPDVTVLIDYVGDFGVPALGAQSAQAMMAEDADVIFGVGGLTGNGAVLTATQSGEWGIGVDTDQWISLFMSGTVSGSDRLLSSAMKRIDNAVYDTISDVVDHTFTSGSVLYDLAAAGVGLAPFHEADPSVPITVRRVLDSVERGIVKGNIDVNGPCATLVGLIPDQNGLDDLTFNWSSYQGLLRAEDELGIVGIVYTSTSASDYEPNLQQCVADDSVLCISVGFATADAISNTAVANPETDFAIIDYTYETCPSNLRGITFASDQVGYLAGTLAGMMTVSDVIGAVGGMDIPPVANYIDGYRNGAQCANPNVTVLVTYVGNFSVPDLGAQSAQALMAEHADVIFGVGGLTGNGAVLTATQSGEWGIGVDTDQWISLFMSGTVSGSDRLLSSAMKRIDNAVHDTIDDELLGVFTAGTVRYDLAVDGVGLAPFHETDGSVPQRVKGALERAEHCILLGICDPLSGSCPSYIHVPLCMKRYGP
ncbi:MAG TPA: BMP family ABC transporter substrate-binding protein [Anaerolineae bacterium]|nr:BMP family ABC transporter substrate-binding protein [Anaerolineae bacterium]